MTPCPVVESGEQSTFPATVGNGCLEEARPHAKGVVLYIEGFDEVVDLGECGAIVFHLDDEVLVVPVDANVDMPG